MEPGFQSSTVTARFDAGGNGCGIAPGLTPSADSSSTTRSIANCGSTTVLAICDADAGTAAAGMKRAYEIGCCRSNSVAWALADVATFVSVRRKPGSESGAEAAGTIR